MSNIADEILRTIKYAVDRKAVNCDRTYQSVVKRITPKGYVVLDEAGSERTVQCCIPGFNLRVMQKVWVKEPMGDLKGLHICGVVGNTSKSSRRNRTR
ncbi:MAG: hypothetical protein HDQ97_06165 [Lachnospiraceae bacterium]|nr:hypothetical protein [Lachnospiraceae bacterium]